MFGAPLCPCVLEEAAVGVAAGEAPGNLVARLGIGKRTLERWKARPDFRFRVLELREQMTHAACGLLAKEVTAAAATLSSLLQSDDDRVRLAAARELLTLGPSFRHSGEYGDSLEKESAEREAMYQEEDDDEED
jgi:hypothetical protein